jgi:hypothetical protein
VDGIEGFLPNLWPDKRTFCVFDNAKQIVEDFNGRRILYSKEKILQNLTEMGMTHLEAEEYYDFNILGLYVSEQNPIFLEINV